MSDDPMRDLSAEELKRQVANLESEEWLATLKALKPVAGVDMYAIGYAAGKQSAQAAIQLTEPSRSSVWWRARTAVLSSALSIAATMFFMTASSEVRDRENTAPTQGNVATTQSPVGSAAKVAEPIFESMIPQNDDLLAEVPAPWRERINSTAPKFSIADNSELVADIDPSRLVYSFQRRQLIESLRGNIQ